VVILYYICAMYIQRNKIAGKNGNVYTAVYLCRKYRENGKVKTEIISNLSQWPLEIVDSIENIFKKGLGALIAATDIIVKSAIDYGHVFLLLHLMRKLKIDSTLDKTIPQYAPHLKTIIIGKIVTRGSKLGIYNWIMRSPVIAGKIGIDTKKLKVDDLYQALIFASIAHEKIEKKWFTYHGKNKNDDIFLYDITSTYFEGTQNELAAFGYNRDKKQGKKQINIGLITDSDGFPLKIEAFNGNVNDHKTVLEQVQHLKDKFNAKNFIFVGDRGMKIKYNLEKLTQAQGEGIDYITGLTHMEIEQLMRDKVIDLNLFTKDLAEIQCEDIRYILSENPQLKAEETAFLKNFKTRLDKDLIKITEAWQKKHAKHLENQIRLAKGDKNKKLVTQYSVKQLENIKKSIIKLLTKKRANPYYDIIEISNSKFEMAFNQEKYENALQMAGKYVVTSTVKSTKMATEQVRETYKKLQNVEHAFRDFKSDNIQLHPVYHRNQAQTRGHVLMSMFSYSIIKEMENKIFPFLKTWNLDKNQKLAFNDIIQELESIKLCTINLGKGADEKKVTELNELQTKVLNLFDMKKSDLETVM